jgi:hypothetical protein
MLPDTARADLTAGHQGVGAPNQLPLYELYFQQTFSKGIKLLLPVQHTSANTAKVIKLKRS